MTALVNACVGAPPAPEPRSAPPKDAHDPFGLTSEIQSYRLKNGLTVLLNPDDRAALAAVSVVYKVGHVNDPPGQAGIAHLIEHLLFHGSRHVPELKLPEYLEQAGAATFGGVVTDHYTRLWALVPSEELPLALWLESDRMAYALEGLLPNDLEQERRIIDLERAERIDSVPNGRHPALTSHHLYPEGHPYRLDPLAIPKADQATVQDLERFRQDYLTPKNAALVISGSFDGDLSRRLVEHYFDHIPERPLASEPTPAAPDTTVARHIEVEARVDRASVQLYWHTPAFHAPGDAELDIAARLFGTRYLRPLVLERGLALSLYAYQLSRVFTSVFVVGGEVAQGVEPEAVIAAIENAVTKLGEASFDYHQIRNTSRMELANLYGSQDDPLERSWRMAESALQFGNPNFMEADKKRYEKVTSSDLEQAVQKHLARKPNLVSIVRPSEDAPLYGRLREARP